MNPITKIRNAGFSLELDGDSLTITPFSQLTPNQLAFLKTHKAEIIDELRQEQAANSNGISQCDENKIRTWLAFIGETNPAMIADVLEQCRTDPTALRYFLQRSDEATTPPPDDDRHFCREYRHLVYGRCVVQRFRPVDTHPRRCADFYDPHADLKEPS